jgi:hypothetical protein
MRKHNGFTRKLYLVDQPVVNHGATDALEELEQRFDFADADCRNRTASAATSGRATSG